MLRYAKISIKANHFGEDGKGKTDNKQKKSDQYCEETWLKVKIVYFTQHNSILQYYQFLAVRIVSKMSWNDKDQAVSISWTFDDFKTWNSVASLRNLSVNGSVDVLPARYVPILNYIEAKFYLKEHCCSTFTCLEYIRLVVSR